MPCVCTVELSEIVHTGRDIGDDWSYHVTVGGVTVEVEGGKAEKDERIRLDPPYRWSIEASGCEDEIGIPVRVRAEEHDLIFSDKGERTRTLTVTCPEAGEGPNRFDNLQLVARVTEQPFFKKVVHWVTFVFDIETICTDSA